MAVEVGSVLEGKVTGITHFGAFVELPDGVTGLVHISEIADTYVRDVRDYLTENQVVKVKVINVSDGRVGLSIRQVYGPPQRSGGRGARGRGSSFEEKLQRFMKESEQRQQDLRRSMDSKRGGRGTRRG
ncbi:MAG: S1 RNA-binding domain-containing protein [Limnochordaceae bacterium]|uniref:S1 RNA-binding domain-containing protein n=1 Tax=Carboxydichorda subterranea TaxID=3109565 RepID=A0ABZ1BW39_9FIRM|nr:S1 RNA-binding domain-containing protein [Limnochorda sp. L945t]MBE3599530.1 S1 RNA-binding domain-containing protein [Limnochordaceae bacterium]WRP17006.1 S1 RNA-binding domain-containing protein [Limnochorda sp. L945t]